MTNPERKYCRRAGGSWIETKTTETALGKVEEITLYTAPRFPQPEPEAPKAPPKLGQP